MSASSSNIGGMTCVMALADGHLSFVTSGGDGWRGLSFQVSSPEHGLLSWDRFERSENGFTGSGIKHGIGLCLEASISKNGAVLVTPVLSVHDKNPLRFSSYGFRPLDGIFLSGRRNGAGFYAHSDNLRIERFPQFRSVYPYIRPIPDNSIQLGGVASEPVPVIFMGDLDSGLWLMEGAVTQNRHWLSWNVSHSAIMNSAIECESVFKWLGTPFETVESGASMRLETMAFNIFSSSPDGMMKSYIAELPDKQKQKTRNSKLASEAVYCTWNFNVFSNISEEDCLRRIPIAAKLQGGKGYFQLDHGYQPQLDGSPAPYIPFREATPTNGTMSAGCLDTYYPDPSMAWDKLRFPGGHKTIVAACKQHGLKPAIWWTPRVHRNGPIRKTHPEWLLADKDGTPIDPGGHLCLDFSVPEAFAFAEGCIRTIVQDWGFEGIKLDFFSWSFDHPDIRFRNGGTNVVWKRRFVGMIRSMLKEDAYFLHCISCPSGNPLLADYGFNAFRAGMDIHDGSWEKHKGSVAWSLPSLLASGRDTWLANMDSCMGDVHIPETERRSRMAFVYATSGMLEFGGPLELLDENAKSDYSRLCERCDAGGGFECPDVESSFTGLPHPKIIVRRHSRESVTFRNWGISTTVALLNWSDKAVPAGFDLASLGVSSVSQVMDFWTGKSPELSYDNTFLLAKLPPMGHLLLDIKGKE